MSICDLHTRSDDRGMSSQIGNCLTQFGNLLGRSTSTERSCEYRDPAFTSMCFPIQPSGSLPRGERNRERSTEASPGRQDIKDQDLRAGVDACFRKLTRRVRSYRRFRFGNGAELPHVWACDRSCVGLIGHPAGSQPHCVWSDMNQRECSLNWRRTPVLGEPTLTADQRYGELNMAKSKRVILGADQRDRERRSRQT